jgi:hypothetical protein
MFMQLRGECMIKVFIFVQHLSRGTVQYFKLPQLHKHNRYAQCRGTDKVLRTLAHLLAAHSRATPKQAKEPKS